MQSFLYQITNFVNLWLCFISDFFASLKIFFSRIIEMKLLTEFLLYKRFK